MEEELFGNLICVGIHIRKWGGQKNDRTAVRYVEKETNAHAGSGKFTKYLVPKDSLKEIESIASEAYKEHYRLTLPWGDGGFRIVTPDVFFYEYSPIMEDLRIKYSAAVTKFLNKYSDDVQLQQERLGSLFNPYDYPTVTQMREKFAFKVTAMPVPTHNDFRVTSLNHKVEKLKEDWEQQCIENAQGANEELLSRLVEAISKLADVDKKQRIHSSLIDGVVEAVKTVRSLNRWDIKAINEFADDIESALVSTETLRDSQSERDRVAEKMRRLLDKTDEVRSGLNIIETLTEDESAEEIEDRMGFLYGQEG